MTAASSTASTALESKKRASALGPEIPVLVGRPRPLAVAPKAAGERKEGVVERERCFNEARRSGRRRRNQQRQEDAPAGSAGRCRRVPVAAPRGALERE